MDAQILKKMNLDEYAHSARCLSISPLITLKHVDLNDIQKTDIKKVKIDENKNQIMFYTIPKKKNIFQKFINKIKKISI